ncbi:MAG TPA: hypothetical protein GX700_05695 [Paracoccus sp.]|nr:hypothetical protein [Paracoccus sp. (in: a-proteobacteria)]
MAINGLSKPEFLMAQAMAALSPQMRDVETERLHWFAHNNPFPEGRAREAATWDAHREERARRLIWC